MDSTEHDTLPIEPVSKDPAAEDSIHVIDFLDEYVKQCTIKKVKVIESLRIYLQTSIDDGYIPKSLTLKGSKDDLRENRIDDNGAYVIFRALNNNCYLTVIDLSYNEIGDKGASYIAEFIKTDTRVKRFILKSNNISQQGGALLGKSLMVNDFIQEFDISYNEIGHLGGMEFAATLQVNTTLTKLLLSHCSLSTDALIALSTVLCSTRTIKTLCLSNNENNFSRLTQSCINDIIMHVSHMVKENRGVERLGLAKSGISDFMMVQYLAPAILVNHRIARLDLSCNKFTRDGGVSLCQALYKQIFLTHLNLSCCAIQDEGAEAVSVMLIHNKALQTLFLDHNRIGSRGLRNIAEALLTKNRSLKCITLWGNFWDEPACKEFAPLVGGPRNIDKENLGGPKKKPAAPPSNTRLVPEMTDICFYLTDNVLTVCRNDDMHNKDFLLNVEILK